MCDEFIPSRALSTSVLFLIFNRLDTTKEVFDLIRQAKPPRLYLASDGARTEKENEKELVNSVREYVLSNVDWKCEIKTLFREKNLGCKYAVSEAITWFFNNEERGIILEDDCIPSLSFFWYCEDLLSFYECDEDVYLISGDSRGSEAVNLKEDYSFCKYPLIWGWASWSRVWSQYDAEIKDWPLNKKLLTNSISPLNGTRRYWSSIFDKVYKNKIDTWDYQFSYLLLRNNAKCVVPRINLISNIGFGEGATHTFDVNSKNSNRTRQEFNFPIKHNLNPESESEINFFYDRSEFYKKKIIIRVINKLLRFLGFV